MTPQTLTTTQGRRIAFHQTPGKGPGVVFLGGLKSDMQGSKALHLEDWARRTGRAFLRFDYSGHGESSGAFTDGCIGDWAEDAEATILTLTEGPQVLIGSSMGGWQALLLARKHPQIVAGLIGIAAAPDFTEDSMWAGFTEAQKAEMAGTGRVALPSDYGEPYIITRRMIEDGRDHLVLRSPLRIDAPVRLLQGTADRGCGDVGGAAPAGSPRRPRYPAGACERRRSPVFRRLLPVADRRDAGGCAGPCGC